MSTTLNMFKVNAEVQRSYSLLARTLQDGPENAINAGATLQKHEECKRDVVQTYQCHIGNTDNWFIDSQILCDDHYAFQVCLWVFIMTMSRSGQYAVANQNVAEESKKTPQEHSVCYDLAEDCCMKL